MGTIIKSISFRNFYNYYGDYADNTYTFKEGINIINAENNLGKSKMYNGFLWVLKDEVYDSDEKKIFQASDSYSKMISKKARRESDDVVFGVRIIFENEEIVYTVTKEVICTKDDNKWNYVPTTDVSYLKDNANDLIDDIQEKKDAIRKMIPADMEKYSLLQGESMERLVDLSTMKGLENTINALADINNLIYMRDVANQLVAQAKKDLKNEEKRRNNNDSKLTFLQSERDKYEGWIEGNREKITIARKEIARATEEKTKFESEFFSSSKRIKLREEYEKEKKLLNEMKKDKEHHELSITSRLFDENHPWLLYGLQEETANFDDYRIALTKELAKREIIENPDILLPEGSPDSPSLQRMLDRCHCEVCDREAPRGSAAWLHIKQVKDRPRKPMRVSNSFVQYYGELQTSFGRYATTIQNIDSDYNAYMDAIDKIDEDISAQDQKVRKLEDELTYIGVEDRTPEEDMKILSNYNLAEKTISDKGSEIQKLTSKIKIWEDQLKKIKEDISKKQENINVKKAEKNLEDLMWIASIFESTLKRIFNKIVDNLQLVANDIYSSLTEGSQTLGGTLQFDRLDDGTVKVRVLGADGEELTGNGTGFQRMKHLAIVMSIISSKVGSKRFDYPFISDAPFSEFGVNLIDNFLNIAPNVFSQSIIMIKDLYDNKHPRLIKEGGLEIANKIRHGEIKGTFYVNYAQEKADASNLVTQKYCYSD